MWNFLPWWLLRKAMDTGSSLLNGLVSYWPLDETSGVRYDAVGGNDLTDNNTVGAVLRGPEGTVASFVAANSESLSVADNPTLAFGEAGEGCTLAVWTRLTGASSGYGQILGRGWSGGRPIEVATETGATTPLYFRIEAGGSVQTSTAYPQDSGWHLVLLWFDPSDKKARLSIDNGTPVVSTAAANAALDPTTAPFEIGGGTGGVGSITGNLGEAAIWNRVLTSDERTALFNSGNGLRYADLPAGLLTGLVSWWDLDEVSGVRYDSHGSNDLTDNNTVGSVHSGPKGVVGKFVSGSSEYLSKADSASDGLRLGGSYAISAWFKPTGHAAAQMIVSKDYDTVRGYALYYRSTQDVYLQTGIDGGLGGHVTTDTAIDNEWNHIIAEFDVDTGVISLTLNGGATSTSGDVGNTPNTMTAPFEIGREAYPGFPFHFDGQIGDVTVHSRILTAGERSSLFNSGRGKRYDDLTTAEKVGLVSYWNLDEASGVRYDSHGSNDLTDNNTVGSIINAGAAMDGAAASFVAANSESLTKASLGFDWTAAWALSLWAKFADSSAYYDFINVTGGPIRVYRAIATGNVTPSFNSAATNPASTYVADNEWVMLTFWHDGSGEYGYSVNNAAPITASGTQCGAGTNLFFGIYSDGGSNPLSGWMDEVAIWSRVLTADERDELYNLGRGKFYDFS